MGPVLYLGIIEYKSPFERRRLRLHLVDAGKMCHACPVLSQEGPGRETSLERSAFHRASLRILEVTHGSKTSTLSQVDIHVD